VLYALIGVAAIILLVPLGLIVRALTRPARRAWLVAAPLWMPATLWLICLGAWAWVVATDVEISFNVHGPVQLAVLILALLGVYLVWIVFPVVALTWTVARVRRSA
jgi:hypothetical protein